MPNRKRAFFIAIALILPAISVIVFAPVASATGGCLFCTNGPFSHPIAGFANTLAGCATYTDWVHPSFSSPNAVIDEESASCNGAAVTGGSSTVDASAGANKIAWTAGVSKLVTVTIFWNVSWNIALSATGCNGANSIGNINGELWVNGSVWDATATSGNPNTITNVKIFDLNTLTSCPMTTGNVQSTQLAFQVTFTFTTVATHVYDFDSRMDVSTYTFFNVGNHPPHPAVTADSRVDAGTGGLQGTISSVEVY